MSPKYSCYSGSWLNVTYLKFFIKNSGHQQRWPLPLPGAILIPKDLLVVADFAELALPGVRPLDWEIWIPEDFCAWLRWVWMMRF